MVRSIALSLAIICAGFFTASSGPAAAQTGLWTCSAEKLKSGSYKGGKTARIHLSPYSSGGSYPVTKVSDTEVTGVTKDGTPFVCVKS
jgi:hypothetical protein